MPWVWSCSEWRGSSARWCAVKLYVYPYPSLAPQLHKSLHILHVLFISLCLPVVIKMKFLRSVCWFMCLINMFVYFRVFKKTVGKKKNSWNFWISVVKTLFFFYVSDTDIKELEDVFGLNGQVEHKLNFLKKNVSKDIKLVLIAHSIGCYITLEMMKRASELQVYSSYRMELHY